MARVAAVLALSAVFPDLSKAQAVFAPLVVAYFPESASAQTVVVLSEMAPALSVVEPVHAHDRYRFSDQ